MIGCLSSLLVSLRNLSFRLCDFLFRQFIVSPSRADGPVVVLRPDGIGDFVIWCNAAHAIKKLYTPRKIILLANHVFSDLAGATGYFDEVIPFDFFLIRRSLRYRLWALWQVRSLQPSILINPVFHRYQLHMDNEAFVRALRAGEVIGWSQVQRGTTAQRAGDRLYTRLIERDYAGKPVNRHNISYVKALDTKHDSDMLPCLPALRTGSISDLDVASDYFVLFPAASSPKRRWPSASFAEIGRRLHAQTGWQGVVTGALADVPLCEEICRASDGYLRTYAGVLSLPQVATLIRNARLLLSNETGVAHIGGACQTPTVCILGGGHYGQFLPFKNHDEVAAVNPCCVFHAMPCFGCGWACFFSNSQCAQPVPCIARIGVEQVWDAVRAQFSGNGAAYA